MGQFVSDNLLLEAAHHQAQTALRLGRRGDEHGRNSATNRMYDTLERCHYPYFTTSRMLKRLGHKKSVVLGFSRPLISLALTMELD